MLPERNNVYGLITAPGGLEPVLRAIEQDFIGGEAYIYRSQFNGAETLHLQSATADFESDHLDDGGQHSLNGSVGGSREEVIRFVRSLSESLSRSEIQHSFEVYDDERLIQRIPDTSLTSRAENTSAT